MRKENKTKRKPQDSTMRNVRAINKRMIALEKRVKRLEKLCCAS